MRLRFFASLRWNLLVFFFYLFLAGVITWPLVTVLGTHFAGYSNGDAHEMTRHIWWFKHALQTGQPLFFQPLLAYPDGLEGVILWSNPLQFFPAWLFAFVMPLPAAYNLQALLNLALNGWAAFFLVRHLTRHTAAALLAGVVFMASPAIQGHLAGGHGGLLVQWPLPLLAWALVRLREQTTVNSHQSTVISRQSSVVSHQSSVVRLQTEKAHASFLITLFLVLLPLGHTLQLIYAGLPLVGLFALRLLAERNRRALWRLIVAVAAALLVLLVFLLPVARATFGTSAYTDEGGSVTYSLDLLAPVTPSFYHPLYGQWEYTHRVLGTNIVEGSAYAGVIVALLALIAVWKRREFRWWLLLALAAYLLALGPLLKLYDRPVSFTTDGYETFITLPWALLQDVPIFSLARTPGRFNFVLALAASVLAGYGVSSLQSLVYSLQSLVYSLQSAVGGRQSAVLNTHPSSLIPRTSYLISAVFIVLILLDIQSFWPLPTYSAEIPDAVAALSQREDVRAVFDMPWDNVLAAKDALWLQTAHEKPMIAGHVSRKTPVNPAKLTYLQETIDPALLKEAGADVLILHKQYDYSDHRLRLGIAAAYGEEPFYEDERFALFNVPQPGEPTTTNIQITYEDRIDWYAHTDQPGWMRLQDVKRGIESDGREVVLLLDDVTLHRWQPGADNGADLWIPVPEPGYHLIRLMPLPVCPQVYDRALKCPAFGENIQVGHSLHQLEPRVFQQTPFDRGLALNGSTVSLTDQLAAALWWQFDQPRTEQDIRFIKVLDQDGSQVAGVDETLGNHEAGSQWIETLTLDLPDDVPPGEYGVYAGWYTYPEMQRFAVLADTPRAQDGLAFLGSVTVK